MAKLDNKIFIQEFNQVTADHYKLLLDADPSKQVIDSYLQRAHKFELSTGGKIVGIIVLLTTRPETVEIVNIAVDPIYQNQGLGEKLIRFAFDWSKRNNYRTIEIGTGTTSFAQLYLYQKCGFRIIGVDPNFFVDNYDQPIIENKLILKDMLRLKKILL